MLRCCFRYVSAAERKGTSLADARNALVVRSSFFSFFITESQSECMNPPEFVCWDIERAVRMASNSMLKAECASKSSPFAMCSVMMGRYIQFVDLLMITRPADPRGMGLF